MQNIRIVRRGYGNTAKREIKPLSLENSVQPSPSEENHVQPDHENLESMPANDKKMPMSKADEFVACLNRFNVKTVRDACRMDIVKVFPDIKYKYDKYYRVACNEYKFGSVNVCFGYSEFNITKGLVRAKKVAPSHEKEQDLLFQKQYIESNSQWKRRFDSFPNLTMPSHLDRGEEVKFMYKDKVLYAILRIPYSSDSLPTSMLVESCRQFIHNVSYLGWKIIELENEEYGGIYCADT